MPQDERPSEDSAKRIAILLAKPLRRGESANAAAILMGQVALEDAELFSAGLADPAGKIHAGIRFSTIVLAATESQLEAVATRAMATGEFTVVVLSSTAQQLHNRYDDYARAVQAGETGELVGVAISGYDGQVRQITKSFSLLQ